MQTSQRARLTHVLHAPHASGKIGTGIAGCPQLVPLGTCTHMQPASNLPDELQLYLALVGLLRERGLACASMQVDVKPHGDGSPAALLITGTPAARSLLSPVIARETGRLLDPDDEVWRIPLEEAWKLIDCCAVL